MNILFKMFLKLLLPIILVLILLVAISKFIYVILAAIGVYLMMICVSGSIMVVVASAFANTLNNEMWMAAGMGIIIGFIVSPYGLPAVLVVVIDKLEDLKDDLIDL